MGWVSCGHRRGWGTTLGSVAVACALGGLFAWFGYGTFAMRGIRATISRDPAAAQRMATYAAWFSFTHLVLGVSAVALGSVVIARDKNAVLARGLGRAALALGVVVLLLLLILV